MSKGLKALEILESLVAIYGKFEFDFTDIEKELKALEIIKEKEVNIYKIRICDSLDEYNKLKSTGRELTQEEYELLKEVLL